MGLYVDVDACNNDGGDCDLFLYYYPYCNASNPNKIGNGICDGGIYFTEDCGFDGGDCDDCNVPYKSWVGNSICDGGQYMTEGCSMDGKDCRDCNQQIREMEGFNASNVGDGKCDIELNTTACSYDGYDCIAAEKPTVCELENNDWLGDGFCDGGAYNTPQCDFDGGDCVECNAAVPDPSKIGKYDSWIDQS